MMPRRGSLWLAPMMGYTHGWFRSMIQALHPEAYVMTEMVTAQALLYGAHPATLWIHPLEHAPVMQLACGSADECRLIVDRLASMPFSHLNLNAGCPSGRVALGSMGASMMYDASRTREVLSAMCATGHEVSLKTRLSVDDCSDEAWDDWCDVVMTSGIHQVFLHARSAILGGLNPAQNRRIPPLRYDRASEIAQSRPSVQWVLNGGLSSVTEILSCRDNGPYAGVMLGRVAYQCPEVFWRLAVKDGLADFARLAQWGESVSSEPLTAPMVCALLALTKSFPSARALRQAIVDSKGKKFNTAPLLEALHERYTKSEDKN